jgi:hypothetical protein
VGEPILSFRLILVVEELGAAAESSKPTMSKQRWLFEISFGFVVDVYLDTTFGFVISTIFAQSETGQVSEHAH